MMLLEVSTVDSCTRGSNSRTVKTLHINFAVSPPYSQLHIFTFNQLWAMQYWSTHLVKKSAYNWICTVQNPSCSSVKCSSFFSLSFKCLLLTNKMLATYVDPHLKKYCTDSWNKKSENHSSRCCLMPGVIIATHSSFPGTGNTFCHHCLFISE